MTFRFVIAWEQELFVNGKMDSAIENLLMGLHKYNIEAFLIPEDYKGAENLAEILMENGLKAEEGIFIASTDTALAQTDKLPIAAIGFCNPDFQDQNYETAQILVEGFEEVDFYFLERIYNRKHQIPWRVIDTKRCYLREMTMGDLDALYELYNGKDMTKYMEPLYEDRKEEEAYTRAYIDNQYYYYGYGMWLVMERETDRLIGRAGLDNHEIHGQIELEMGYAIAYEKQRQGYGTEICRAIIRYAEEFLEFPRLNCLVRKENKPSIQLLHKLGFTWKEELDIDGEKMQRYTLEF